MDQTFGPNSEQAEAFQKIWMDSATKMFQAACATSAGSPPPEVIKQIRSGIFAALAQSWDQFMRSPQFLDAMKQWMETAINFRKMTNDFMARVRTELQAPSRDDTDSLMLSIRHMEKRLLDRMEELAAEVQALKEQHRPSSAGTAKLTKSKTKRSRKTASA